MSLDFMRYIYSQLYNFPHCALCDVEHTTIFTRISRSELPEQKSDKVRFSERKVKV